jgi:hypothetical protein
MPMRPMPINSVRSGVEELLLNRASRYVSERMPARDHVDRDAF